MKTLNFLHFILLLFFINHWSESLSAQTIYKTVNDITYAFDENNHIVYRQTSQRNNPKEIANTGFEVKNKTAVREACKKVLSKARLKELRGEKMAVYFECDSEGKVEKISFVFTKAPFLTPIEINKIESMLLSTINVDSNVDEGAVIRFAIPCFFSKLLDDI